ncbi:hypothetical protein, partial [Pantoea ananatis]|uniref:hypothetical protein n=1 Tax=Pantoea ananas TaxID=553 RepID=UPI003C29609F
MRKSVSSFLIFIQVFLILFPSVTGVSRAAEIHSFQEMKTTMSAISDLTKAGSGNSGEAKTEKKSANTPSVNIHSYSPGYIPAPPGTGGQTLISSPLPSLGIPDKAASDDSSASRTDNGFWKQDGGEIQSSPYSGEMSQAAGVLSSVRNSEEAVNYARSIGQGLLNQKINGWISQYGTGNV